MTSSFRSLEPKKCCLVRRQVGRIMLTVFVQFCWDRWAAFNPAIVSKVMSGSRYVIEFNAERTGPHVVTKASCFHL